MNTVITATIISVLGAGLIGMFFHYLRDLSTRFSSLELAVKSLDTKFTEEFKALDTKFTGQLHNLDAKFTGQFQALDTKFTQEFQALDTKFTGQFNDQGQRIDGIYDVLLGHGERLARIEPRLDTNQPTEAT